LNTSLKKKQKITKSKEENENKHNKHTKTPRARKEDLQKQNRRRTPDIDWKGKSMFINRRWGGAAL